MTPTEDLDGPVQAPAQTLKPEESLLACCLLDEGATLDRAISLGMKPHHFTTTQRRDLFSSLLQLRAEGQPVTMEVLAARLMESNALAGVGGFPELFRLTDINLTPTTTYASHHIRAVLDASERGRMLREAQRVVERLRSTDDLGEIGEHAKRISPEAAPSNSDDVEKRRVTISAKPPEPITRLFLAGKPVATPGNLGTLISKAKTGKTATIGGVVAAIIAAAHDRTGLDTLHFTAPHNKEAVVLIDTEQSPYDAFTCHQRAFARAGQQGDLAWLCHYALVDFNADRLRQSLPTILTRAKAAHGGVFLTILDGVADYVKSVNDEAECNDFVSWLRGLAVEFNCPILCVIHSNEAVKAGDDGRGHLGKQLARKAESNLLLSKTGEVTTITSDKQRKAPITADDNVSFQWSDEQQRHVSVNAPKKSGNAKSHYLDDYLSVFPHEADKAKPFAQLHRLANTKRPISRNTFWNLVEQGSQAGSIEVNATNPNEPRYWVS